ncbi:carboxyl transferase domain-containing protein [Streptomyces cinereoruber]|uniref:Acetyl-coenzyme A carboxylase carboxyl transferase subunits beta/alpha n=1 Tax=Streptomyces cinereoruber TaxID=67260 RepID=A0ABX6BLH8_9ACTN|nr:carboxyl transferase domain-containing protein [Streptomyces cinereoruber]MBB4161114.1 acetyl-CoA carboxylase carboxyl transferase subunit beta [Streptomyces cinereoruber]MBY8819770.1 acetyl-CoA carboxylase [Streptomyces cinereoruber]NIH63492.1 acetyl-CoA carboxylase carboxyl transferase subunit beta [Streptomyces cinereoruber]QEV36129.1 acetyl-CoA carboxylase [Streptomyces cinereoruber]
MSDPTTARGAIALVADEFTELPFDEGPLTGDGPIGWPGYSAAHARAAARTGETESVVCGTGSVGGVRAVLISFEFRFLGGSLGERTGARAAAAHALARERRLPVVVLPATGGSRMHEGMRALLQLQVLARESELTRAAGLPQIAVLRDPTTGGGWATLGAGSDVVLALPGAQVAFAGSRVRPPDADPAAYTAEAQLAHGHVDAIVPPDALRAVLGRWLSLLTRPAEGPVAPPYALGDPGAAPAASGREAVARARHPDRPRAGAYLDAHFTLREEISGDRCGGVDPGTRCGFGRLPDGRTVAYAAQCGTATRPAGFRTAARLVRLAGRLDIPVLTLVDTPGAANDAEAERSGAGSAIADLFAAVAGARTPVTSLLVGEGGSGGALALAAPGNSWTTPDAYFSVIAPEAAAAILKRPPEEAGATADRLRLRPEDLVELGIVRGVVGPRPASAEDVRDGA